MKPFIGHLWYHKKGPFFLIRRQTLAQRKAQIVSKNADGTWYKPVEEHATRLRLIRKIAWKGVPKPVREAYRALTEVDRVWAEADRALTEADRVWVEAYRVWAEADRVWVEALNGPEMMALHDRLCSEEDWDKKKGCIRFPEVRE